MATLTQMTILVVLGFVLGLLCARIAARVYHRFKVRRSIVIDPQNALQIAAKYANDGLVIQDIEGHVEWLNSAYTEITGYHLDELFGKKPQRFLIIEENMPSDAEIEAFRYDCEDSELDRLVVRRNRRKDGTEFWNEMHASLAEIAPGIPPKVVVVSRDVTLQVEREEALREAESKLIEEMERDHLTKTANRLKLNSFLDSALQDALINESEVGLISLDLDKFKKINDELGHAAGDAVLIHAANVMKNAVSKDDLVCRMGGDEFVIVCPGVRGFADLKEIGRTIIKDISRPFRWEDQHIEFGVSIGAVLSKTGEDDIDALLRRVDMALYKAKNTGRGRLVCFDVAFEATVSAREEEMQQLTRSAREEDFEMAFQPIICAKRRIVLGLESFIRWNHPTKGLLAPNAFFDLAKELDIMELLDRIAIKKALDGAVAFNQATPDPISVGINISPATLARPDFVESLKWEIDARDLRPASIVIEMREKTIMKQTAADAAETINDLNSAGIKVALDDFGVGYAGLAHLARLDVSYVKIDKVLTANILDSRLETTITKTIAEICEELGRQVIAEGIETECQAFALMALGINQLQGFGIARPMPQEEAVAWLEGLAKGSGPPSPVWAALMSDAYAGRDTVKT